MHFDARVCGFCRPLTLLCWHDVSDIFSYYRLFVDDLIDTLGLKLYIYIYVCMYVNPLGEMGHFGPKKQKTRKSTVS